MGVHDGLGQAHAQAQAEADLAVLGGKARLEDARQDLGRDARPVVLDLDAHGAGLLRDPQSEATRGRLPAGPARLTPAHPLAPSSLTPAPGGPLAPGGEGGQGVGGIGQQVGPHLGELAGVRGHDRGRVRLAGVLPLDLDAVQTVRGQAQRVLKDLAHIDVLELLPLGTHVGRQAGHQAADAPGRHTHIALGSPDRRGGLQGGQALGVGGQGPDIGRLPAGGQARSDDPAGQLAVAQDPLQGAALAPLGARRGGRPGARRLGGARNGLALGMRDQDGVEARAQVRAGPLEGRDGVVELVGDPRGQLAERGEALLGEQLHAGLLERGQRLGRLGLLGGDGGRQLDLLDLQDLRARQALGQRPDEQGRQGLLGGGVLPQRPVELLDGQQDELDVGGGRGGDVGQALAGQGDQPDNASGGGVVEGDFADARVAGQRHRPRHHDVDAVDDLPLVGQTHPGRQPQARPGPQDRLAGGDELGGQRVRPVGEGLQQGRAGGLRSIDVGGQQGAAGVVGQVVAQPAAGLGGGAVGDGARRPGHRDDLADQVLVDGAPQVVQLGALGQQDQARRGQGRVVVDGGGDVVEAADLIGGDDQGHRRSGGVRLAAPGPGEQLGQGTGAHDPGDAAHRGLDLVRRLGAERGRGDDGDDERGRARRGGRIRCTGRGGGHQISPSADHSDGMRRTRSAAPATPTTTPTLTMSAVVTSPVA